MDECRRRVGDAVVYCSDMYEAVVDADALVLLTEWKHVRLPSWTVIRKVMANPLVIDGRNIYDKAELVAEGFTYKAHREITVRHAAGGGFATDGRRKFNDTLLGR